MGLLGLFFSDVSSEEEPGIDEEILFPIAKKWLDDAVSNGNDPIAKLQWQAIEHIERESTGGFWAWLRGRHRR